MDCCHNPCRQAAFRCRSTSSRTRPHRRLIFKDVADAGAARKVALHNTDVWVIILTLAISPTAARRPSVRAPCCAITLTCPETRTTLRLQSEITSRAASIRAKGPSAPADYRIHLWSGRGIVARGARAIGLVSRRWRERLQTRLRWFQGALARAPRRQTPMPTTTECALALLLFFVAPAASLLNHHRLSLSGYGTNLSGG
jgi:hypothetical protein